MDKTKTRPLQPAPSTLDEQAIEYLALEIQQHELGSLISLEAISPKVARPAQGLQ